MGQELEWKFIAENEALQEAILAWEPVRRLAAADPVRYRMESVYYDTPDRALEKQRIALRRRLENETSVICVKTSRKEEGNLHLRGEWELEAESPEAALPELVRMGAPEALLKASPLVCVCRADFDRTALTLFFPDGSRSELALDRGTLSGPTNRCPFCEVELELKSGSPDASEAFLQYLLAAFPLHAEPLSKFARAKALG